MMTDSFLQSFFQRLVTWHWGSPSDGDLLALRDNEISDKRRVRVEAHLKQCASCRERAARIAREWDEFAAISANAAARPSFAEDELIADIQASIRAWSEANLPPPAQTAKRALSSSEAERQAVAVLGLYIGQRAAKALLQGIDASETARKEKLAQAESTLCALLGQKSAAAVMEKLSNLLGPLSESTGRSAIP